ncbi:MAG: molybdate ABC transporter substrate-binding protein [bacterium]|jgi:molybdate transport system substrate-binding protein|nr:molybdate ABC transporter substrate-binding protein [bacterium]
MKRWVLCLGIWIITRGVVFAEPVTVYAAASLTSALQSLSKIAQQHALVLRLSFGSSSTLAKQIAQGAPADIFISANASWMDYLDREGEIESATRVDLLGNALVIVVPKGARAVVETRPDFNFAGAFEGRLAVGDPSHVPAGIYAREALIKLGWWPALSTRIAPAGDARAALALVARGECPVGIVYTSDAAMSQDVDVIAVLPDSLLASQIVYPAAVVKGRGEPQVDAVMGFLRSPESAELFRRAGFRVLTAF